MNVKEHCAVCLFVFTCLATAAQAQQPLVIGVNFGAEFGSLASTDAVGVIPSTNWNNLGGASGTRALLANDGFTAGGSVTWGGPSADWNTAGDKSTPDQTMMYGYLDGGSSGPTGNNTPATISFSNLPATLSTSYNVFVYIASDYGTSGQQPPRTGDYTIGGTTILATQGSSTPSFALAGNGVAGNYIEFTGLSGSGFTLVASRTSFRAPVDGIQIVQASLPACYYWTGALCGKWNGLDPNWRDANNNSRTCPDGANVIFDDSSGTNTTVDISAASVSPCSVTFNNSTTNYTLQSNGNFSITGATGLTKSGAGTVTICNTNTFTGATTISSGTLQLGDGTAGHDGSLATSGIINNAVLVYNLNGNQTAGYGISGTGCLTKAGTGSISLTATCSYTGNTIVSGGVLQLNTSNGSAGQLNGTPSITVNNGGMLALNASDVLGYASGREALVINGGAVTNITSNARVTIENLLTMTGGTLTGTGSGDVGGVYSFDNGTVGIHATSDANGNPAVISAAISPQTTDLLFTVSRGVAAPLSDLAVTSPIVPFNKRTWGIIKSGDGVMTLSGINTYTGNTVINGGTLQLNTANGSDGQLGGTPSITVNDGGTLVLNAGDVLGYASNREVLVINGGGTVTNITSDARVTIENLLTMTGGTLTGSGSGDYGGVYSFNNGAAGVHATSDADGNPAVISASISPQNADLLFTVTRGAAAPLSDLNVTAAIVPFNGRTFGIIKSGDGIMTLSGTNTYTGGTVVEEGTLIVANAYSLRDGASLAVGSDASTIFGTAAAGTQPTSATVSPVPEPETLVLLITGLVFGFSVWRKRRGSFPDF